MVYCLETMYILISHLPVADGILLIIWLLIVQLSLADCALFVDYLLSDLLLYLTLADGILFVDLVISCSYLADGILFIDYFRPAARIFEGGVPFLWIVDLGPMHA